MNRKRTITFVVLAVVAVSGWWLFDVCRASGRDRDQVRRRYEQMRAALSAGDTNAAALLIAPARRARARDHYERLPVFARELGAKSAISVSGSRAEVCPERLYPLIPFGMFGHTIEMIKVEGEWYFTGKISVW